MFDSVALGLRIGLIREKNKLTQKDLAKILNVSQTSLSKLETGKVQSINIIKLEKIANALNVTLDELLVDNLSVFKNEKNLKPKSVYYYKLYVMLSNLI